MMLEVVKRYKPDRRSRICDFGTFNSEIPLALWGAGYRRIDCAMQPR